MSVPNSWTLQQQLEVALNLKIVAAALDDPSLKYDRNTHSLDVDTLESSTKTYEVETEGSLGDEEAACGSAESSRFNRLAQSFAYACDNNPNYSPCSLLIGSSTKRGGALEVLMVSTYDPESVALSEITSGQPHF